MIEHLVGKSSNRPMTLYWGGRRARTICTWIPSHRGWVREYGLNYVPVVSDAREVLLRDVRKFFLASDDANFITGIYLLDGGRILNRIGLGRPARPWRDHPLSNL